MLRTVLRPYQQEAVDKADPFDGFLLMPDPRTGKCLISLAIACRKAPDYVVVVCPKNAIRVWHEQHAEHLSHVPWKYWAITYEEFTKNRKRWYLWGKAYGDRTLLILDESHYIKKRGSKRSRTVRHFSRSIKYRLLLTGTPLAQGPQDGWSQMDAVDPTIFGSWDSFADKYLVYGGFKKKQIVGHNNTDDFNRLFHSRAYRISFREARGPERPLLIKRAKRTFKLSKQARALYRKLDEEMSVLINGVRLRIPNVLACCLKQQQIAGGHILVNGHPESVDIGKECLLQDVVERELRGKKLVIVCRFNHEIDQLEGWLQLIGKTVKIVRGGSPFDGKFDVDCILLQVQSGLAVDMSAADATVFYSIDHSFLNYGQAWFRTLNYNKREVSFYYLIAEDTVDEDLYECVTGKKRLVDIVADKYRKRERRTG